ncbi:MAG: DUF4256 domain-containing protein [Fermentimonas sp.]|nr:DUF4256 domain-containing protein [Fermentimonas sp.]
MSNKRHPHKSFDELLQILKKRFEENNERHPDLKWDYIKKKLESSPEKLHTLSKMEDTGGEPDIIGYDSKTGEYIFCDCSPESPSGRRSLCYDEAALESRKQNKPKGSALGMAKEMGIEILDEELYLELQELGKFDNKTSSWVLTPKDLRELGGALFGDKRYSRTFIYHNGAESYYASRGFRGILRV